MLLPDKEQPVPTLGGKPFYIHTAGRRMEKQSVELDEHVIQEMKTISREVVEKEFPDEEEYFDFLFDLIMPELQEMEPGEEPEFLKEIRAVYPLALGWTPVVITAVFQIVTQVIYRDINPNDTNEKIITQKGISKIIEDILGDSEEQENLSGISKAVMESIKKAKIKAKD